MGRTVRQNARRQEEHVLAVLRSCVLGFQKNYTEIQKRDANIALLSVIDRYLGADVGNSRCQKSFAASI
jgi:hypothetical protein